MRYTPPWVDIWEVHVWEMYVWNVHFWKVQLACECVRYMGNFDFREWFFVGLEIFDFGKVALSHI
jgi:hypothetical protein